MGDPGGISIVSGTCVTASSGVGSPSVTLTKSGLLETTRKLTSLR